MNTDHSFHHFFWNGRGHCRFQIRLIWKKLTFEALAIAAGPIEAKRASFSVVSIFVYRSVVKNN
jgi:hypothetical protein